MRYHYRGGYRGSESLCEGCACIVPNLQLIRDYCQNVKHRPHSLILLPEDQNVRIANKSFKKKKKTYEELSIPMDPILAEAKRWDDGEIRGRTEYLAKEAYERIFSV